MIKKISTYEKKKVDKLAKYLEKQPIQIEKQK